MSVTGHKYEKDQDKMVLFLANGGIREVKNWKNCECRLGDDWVNITKEDIKRQAYRTWGNHLATFQDPIPQGYDLQIINPGQNVDHVQTFCRRVRSRMIAKRIIGYL